MAHFVKNFDCKNEEHVMWLKQVGEVTAKTMNGDKIDITKYIHNNPIKGNPTMENPMDWAYIHFQLTMKYATAVLSGVAFIPNVTK
jgi:hypothetical protein|tara:strand:+ start:4869 stop:5126 length:258 start_codon:yes stop_codon:yes gene_type:complete